MKMLRNNAKERKACAKEVTNSLLLRMNKTKPLEEQKHTDTEADVEMK